MQDIQYSNALYQVSEVLKYVEEDLKEKIPKQFIDYIESNKSQEYNWNVDTTKPLEEQELLQPTKEILTVIYRNYMCDDKQREELDRILNENEIKYQNELREKYNPDNVFKGRKKENQTPQKEIENDTAIVVYKESLFKKILNKIKLIFHRK